MNSLEQPAAPGHPRPLLVLRDALVSARTQPVVTVVAALVVAMVCFLVLVTAGRSAATERAVIASIDSVGTRLVTVADATGNAQISASSVADIAQIDGVTWAFGLGEARDARNAHLPVTGRRAAVRDLVGHLPADVVRVVGRLPEPGEAVAGAAATATLGLGDSSGAVTDGQTDVAVVGQLSGTGALAFLDELVLVRADAAGLPGAETAETVRYIYLVVDDTSEAARVTEAVTAVLRSPSPADARIEASTGAIALREVVSGRLGASARQTMAGVLAVGLVLVAITLGGGVAGRRRDFGRRRALGASRSAIVVLVLVHSATAAGAGAVVGTAAGLIVVHQSGGGLPPAAFVAGTAVLAVVVALVGCLPPAIAAARRDPVRILRVP